MTEAEWLACEDPQAMFAFVQRNERVSLRKLRLFAAACARSVWPHLRDERSRSAIEVAERFIEGSADNVELARAADRALEVARIATPVHRTGWLDRFLGPTRRLRRMRIESQAWAHTLMPQLLVFCVYDERGELLTSAGLLASSVTVFDPGESRPQAEFLRDIVGNPFRAAPVVQQDWLAWNGGTIPALAREIWEARAFDRLPMLADALEDAGCADAALLGHCRSGGEHVRGCWALDLVLGKD